MLKYSTNQHVIINDNFMSLKFTNNIEVCLTLLNNFRGLRHGK
uniref:Uncharacterized protein n=1 Tax=Sphingobacterium sp. (strain 21) TaxID=743722 RepID=F4C3I9_SPHS2